MSGQLPVQARLAAAPALPACAHTEWILAGAPLFISYWLPCPAFLYTLYPKLPAFASISRPCPQLLACHPCQPMTCLVRSCCRLSGGRLRTDQRQAAQGAAAAALQLLSQRDREVRAWPAPGAVPAAAVLPCAAHALSPAWPASCRHASAQTPVPCTLHPFLCPPRHEDELSLALRNGEVSSDNASDFLCVKAAGLCQQTWAEEQAAAAAARAAAEEAAEAAKREKEAAAAAEAEKEGRPAEGGQGNGAEAQQPAAVPEAGGAAAAAAGGDVMQEVRSEL